jgi:branched-chain amino acid transport system permease protein
MTGAPPLTPHGGAAKAEPPASTGGGTRTGGGLWVGAVAIVALLLLPAVASSYVVTVFIFIFFYGYLGQAWNILGGYGGQLSAGHAAFVGVGAYATTLLSMHWGVSPWIGMLVGGALAAALGAIIGALGFRFGLRGFYFVLLTVAFAEVCRIVALNTEVTGGAVGLYITFTGNPWQLQFRDNRAYYYVALALVLLATGIVAGIERSRLGAYLRAIREDEDAAEALGVDTVRYKLYAIVLSAFLTGLGGAFYANYLFSLQPNAVFGIPLSVDIIIRPVVGGAGTLAGPLVGSLILSPLAEVARIYFTRPGWAGLHLVVYGVLLIGVVLFLPQGVYPTLRRAWARRTHA